MSNIFDGFDDWNDIAENFSILNDVNEPEEILAAVYNGGGYEGDACIIYREGDKYYIASGSHCSCYGLEGQWEPEEYTKSQLINYIHMANFYGATEKASEIALPKLKATK